MRVSRFTILILVCMFMMVGLLTVGCSDNDKSTAASGEWKWSALGVGLDNQPWAFAVYNNKLIAGGYFTTICFMVSR